jgi:hypothetical protein
MIKTAHSFKGISKQYKEMNPDELKEHTCDLEHFHSFDTGEAR